ncbi:hypothetical protein Tco_0268191 [Tanacetum coccineum]
MTPHHKSPTKTSKSGKSVTTEEPVEELFFEMASDALNKLLMMWKMMLINHLMTQLRLRAKLQSKIGTSTSSIKLEYNMEECFKALTDILDWNNPKGDFYPLDLTKPLPLKARPGRLNVAAEYFFNNNLEFLKSSYPEKKYTTSIIKTKAARRYLVWSVYVKKLHGYGHLKEIMVRRADCQVYKFKEGGLVDLHLNNIEYMLLLAIQHKLFQLDGSDIVDLIVALQLYTPSYKPPGLIYEDLNKQKRVTRADELYKFSDGTLKTVRDELHHRILDFRLGCNKEMSMRKWKTIDKRRSELMVELIDKQMRERQIIRNLERLMGARELEMDYRLMTRTK